MTWQPGHPTDWPQHDHPEDAMEDHCRRCNLERGFIAGFDEATRIWR